MNFTAFLVLVCYLYSKWGPKAISTLSLINKEVISLVKIDLVSFHQNQSYHFKSSQLPVFHHLHHYYHFYHFNHLFLCFRFWKYIDQSSSNILFIPISIYSNFWFWHLVLREHRIFYPSYPTCQWLPFLRFDLYLAFQLKFHLEVNCNYVYLKWK